MSTKAIEEALDLLSRVALRERDESMVDVVGKAREEVEAIRSSAKAFSEEDASPESVRAANETLDAIAKEAP